MKMTKTADGKTLLKMSREEWEQMGRTAGWFDGVVDKVKKAFEPDKTNPYIDKSEEMRDDNGTYQLTGILSEQEVLNTTADKVDMNEIESKVNGGPQTDPFFLLTLPRAIKYIREKNGTNKNAGPLKVLLYRLFNLRKGSPQWNKAVAIIQKWYEERVKDDAMWEKPKNPYLS